MQQHNDARVQMALIDAELCALCQHNDEMVSHALRAHLYENLDLRQQPQEVKDKIARAAGA